MDILEFAKQKTFQLIALFLIILIEEIMFMNFLNIIISNSETGIKLGFDEELSTALGSILYGLGIVSLYLNFKKGLDIININEILLIAFVMIAFGCINIWYNDNYVIITVICLTIFLAVNGIALKSIDKVFSNSGICLISPKNFFFGEFCFSNTTKSLTKCETF